MFRPIVTLLVFCMFAATSQAEEFYVDPTRGDAANDGSQERPWAAVTDIFENGLIESRGWDALPYKSTSRLTRKNGGAKVKAGDTIWLRSGAYGDLAISGYYNEKPITISAEKGHAPRFTGVVVRSSSNWTIRGLHVSPEFGDGKRTRTMIDLDSHGWHGPVHDIVVENCTLFSAQDTSAWSAQDWNERARSGIDADGARITIRGNQLKNVNFGISVGASHALVEENSIVNFCGDGLRGLGDHSVFQYNVVKNCYDVNENHDDGFQSWSSGDKGVGRGEVVGMVLRGNAIINFEDPDQPHRGALQGIGCFDGMFVDWVVENNVIIVDHYHGITLSGARGCRIVNNTVIDPNEVRPGPAAIRVGNHKRGTPSSNCVIRNNLATAIHVAAGEGMTSDHNMIVRDKAKHFVNFAKRDMRLREGSPAIDAGTAELAPMIDIAGTVRPQGDAIDIGAYETASE
jgi:hypothetical protein